MKDTASAKVQFDRAISKQLAAEIHAIAKRARTEEDVRLNVENVLRPVLTKLGIATQPKYEQRLTLLTGTGFADAVYGFGIIEYERPGKIATPTGRKEVVRQLSAYLTSKAREIAPTRPIEAVKKMVGIGIDGEQIMYLRYAASANRARFFQPISLETQLDFFEQRDFGRRGGFQIVGPMPVDEASVDWLLYSLQFFQRRALEPRGLAEAFGPDADVASDVINVFYHKLLKAGNPRVEMFFAQWDMIFGVIYGQELERGDAATKELAKLYKIKDKPQLKRLLFAIHTYYVLLMKMLTAELISLQEGSWFTSFTADVEAAAKPVVKEKMEYLENGGLFAQFNIINFLEGDFFRWYLDVWDDDLARHIRHIAIVLQQFEPATATIDPDATRDLLKKLYQYLLPRRVRHDLGEYYTPDWLAEKLIRQIGYDGNPDKRMLDPSCGSGTFLALCIRKAFDYADRYLVRPEELVGKLLANIVGFDLNPLAVIAARTNFLLSLGTLIKKVPRIEIPVYFCDSIITPGEFSREGELTLGGGDRHVDTAEGKFTFPASVIEKDKIEAVCSLIEEFVTVVRTEEQFLEKLRLIVGAGDRHDETLLAKVFGRIQKLNSIGKNGIWARILKNQFAPVFVGKHKFDFVIGNPPWVNWQSLSDAYREKTWQLWESYGLFSLSHNEARHGGGKKDLAMLFTYVCVDNYLKAGGRLGFVITQTLFKTKGAGDGFRRFRLGTRERFRVLQVDDLSDFQPFEGATNRTAVVTFQQGKATRYPLNYDYWRKKPNESISLDDTLDQIHPAKIEVKHWKARPINPSQPESPWITARPKALTALEKVIGPSTYRAYAGSCTWANGIYWLEIIGSGGPGKLIAKNLHKVGKLEDIPSVECALEADLVYPLLRGRDVQKWTAESSSYILNVQDATTRCGYANDFLKSEFPLIYSYLLRFEKLLRQRSGFRKYFCKKVGKGAEKKLVPIAPFYSLYNIGPYTLAPYKVCWREQASFLTSAVVGSGPVADRSVVVIPDHKLMFVPINEKAEADYLCAMLNSSTAALLVKSYIIETSTSTHVLEHLNIPKFVDSDAQHRRLSELSKAAHVWAKQSTDESHDKVAEIEREIDKSAAALWGINDGELGDIQSSLADIQ